MRLTAGNNDNQVSAGCIRDAQRWERCVDLVRISQDSVNYLGATKAESLRLQSDSGYQ